MPHHIRYCTIPDHMILYHTRPFHTIYCIVQNHIRHYTIQHFLWRWPNTGDDSWNCCFQGFWGPCGVPKRKKNRVGRRAGCKVGFVFISGAFWESFWELKSSKQRRGLTAWFACAGGSQKRGFRGSRSRWALRHLTVF